jgi:hypothetical protein
MSVSQVCYHPLGIYFAQALAAHIYYEPADYDKIIALIPTLRLGADNSVTVASA